MVEQSLEARLTRPDFERAFEQGNGLLSLALVRESAYARAQHVDRGLYAVEGCGVVGGRQQRTAEQGQRVLPGGRRQVFAAQSTLCALQ